MNAIAPPGLTAADAEALEAEAGQKRAAVAGTGGFWAARLNAEAAGLDALAAALRDPVARGVPALRRGRGGETAAPDDPDRPWRQRAMAQAVAASPGMLAADASLARLALARDADVLTLAVEAAEDAGAVTAVEKMLAHQLAAAHPLCMDLLAIAAGEAHGHRKAPHLNTGALAEAARTTAAAARLMGAFAAGALALDRLRNGGRQTVTVQHVTVADGGRAVVAGTVRAPRASGKARA